MSQRRWKKLVATVAGIGVIASGAGSVLAFTRPAHAITLSVDNASLHVSTTAATVADLLAEAGVDTDSHDIVIPAPNQPTTNGLTVRVTHAQPAWVSTTHTQPVLQMVPGTSLFEQLLNARDNDPHSYLKVSRTPESATVLPLVETEREASVTVDSQTTEFDAAPGLSAEQALAKSGVTLNPLDRLTLSIDAEGRPALSVTRVSREGTTEDIDVPFETEEQEDDTLFEGQRVVAEPGQPGMKRLTYAVVAIDGTETSREVINEEIISEPQTEIIRVGTRKLPTNLGVANPGTPAGESQQIAAALLPEFGFGPDQFGCLVTLWTKESGWRSNAQNPSSGAYGIPQALPGSKMGSAGADWQTNPATQIRWGLGYIRGRYGTPCGALSEWQRKGWY